MKKIRLTESNLQQLINEIVNSPQLLLERPCGGEASRPCHCCGTEWYNRNSKPRGSRTTCKPNNSGGMEMQCDCHQDEKDCGGSKITGNGLDKLIRKNLRESQLLNEAAACPPKGTPGGLDNRCGVGGDCSGHMTCVLCGPDGSGFCVCRDRKNGWTIQGGSDDGCPQDKIDGRVTDDHRSVDMLSTKGSGFETPQGNSDTLEKFLRRQGLKERYDVEREYEDTPPIGTGKKFWACHSGKGECVNQDDASGGMYGDETRYSGLFAKWRCNRNCG